MTDYFRSHLGAKLLLSYIAIIVVGMVVLVVASQFILPASFNRHMAGMWDPEWRDDRLEGRGLAGMGWAAVRALAAQAQWLSFSAITAPASTKPSPMPCWRPCWWLSFSACFSAAVCLRRCAAMSLATQRIADGHYDERLQVKGADELAQLATRFNQMAEKLDQVEAMRRRLIGDVSHELRTPLTAIKGSMEGLMDGVLPATDETYQQIHAEADRLNRLVDDLQELSRVEARAYELDIRSVDVSSLVRSVTKRLAPQARNKASSLWILNWLPTCRLFSPTRTALVQVLTNLTGNALQYTPEGGRVTIICETDRWRSSICSPRYRHRHSTRTSGAYLRPLLPRGQIALTSSRRRERHRPDDCPRAGRSAGRAHLGRVGGRRAGKHIHLHTANRKIKQCLLNRRIECCKTYRGLLK